MPPTKVGPAVYKRQQRQATHTIEEAGNGIRPGSVGSGLQALLTPTLSTHSGSTVVGQIGTPAQSRMIIPLPAVMATVLALSKGTLVPTPVASGSTTKGLPSMVIDSEWFYPNAYPQELRQYLTTSFSFEEKPKTPSDTLELTQVFLRYAYENLESVGLNIEIGQGFKDIFQGLVAETVPNVPKHPYAESEATRNLYAILAFTLSTLLFRHPAGARVRTYSEVTYPGVIMAAYVGQMLSYYTDLSNVMKLLGPSAPHLYLLRGGRESITDTTALLGTLPTAPLPKKPAINQIPNLTVLLRIAAEYATGRKTDTTGCNPGTYVALQDAAMNVIGVDDATIRKFIALKQPNRKTVPLAEKIIDARCAYYVGLIRGTIKPGDDSAGIPGGEPGLEVLTV